MKSLFTRKTFQYFDLAKKNKFKKGWFEKNKDLYEEAVKEPYSLLLQEIAARFSRRLPGIVISPRKISRPLRPAAKAEEHGYVKAGAMFYLSEKTTSMFEWNPGLYLHLGDEKEDNVIGMGLYGPSSRQIKRLRAAFVQDHELVDRLLADRKLKKYWKKPADEKYVRSPKDYSPENPAAKCLWYKQFFLRRQFTRREVLSKEFPNLVLKSFEAGIPFLTWIRESIGVYDRQEMERAKRDAEEI
ncbi:MAG: DUF2461 family protein [Bdellovibrionota bacterium]